MIGKALLPTDGSETATKAIAFAEKLLEGSKCHVTLLNVVEEPAYTAFWSDGMMAPEVILPPSEELHEELKRRAETVLKEQASLLEKAGMETEIRVRFGNAASEILKEAEGGEYDLVIMGSHGRGVLSGFLLGSVSNRVVHHARCPVLIVRS